jgi:tetratricopeptide (TPR) repeat protein
LAKQGFLKSALAGVGLLRKANAPDFPGIDDPDPENQGTALFRRGRYRMRAGEVENAVKDFDRAIELLPDYAEARVSRAECLDMLGRAEAAQPDYVEARRLWAAERTGAPDRSYIWRQQGRLTFEVESYELALERIKTGSFPHSAMGNTLMAHGRPAEALKAKDKDPALLALKGEALSAMGRYRSAVDAFSASLKAVPRAPEVLSGRAVAYAALGRIDKANVDWRRQLSALPEHQAAARACVTMRLGAWTEALPELERTIEKAPNDPYWQLYRLTALKRLDRPVEPVDAPSGDWPAPLFALHAGKATPETVLAAATTEGRRMEALFQLERFKDVAETAPPHMIEYAAARNELGR